MTSATRISPGEVLAPTVRPIPRSRRGGAGDVWVLSDGRRLRFRPVTADDRDRLAGLFARLSFESRYRRFLSPKPELTPRELAFLTDVDHVGHEAIAAIDHSDGAMVGVARYVRVPDRVGVAAVAVEVVDELHRMGVATALAERLLERARANGFALLIATTLDENRAARALLRRFRFRPLTRHGIEIELELELKRPSDC
jgi:RimJ/RimL family protein N-acetyltransferase